MKNTSIKSVKKLPAWYKLENYKKAKHFDAPEWYNELMPRFIIRSSVNKLINDPIDLPQRWKLIQRDGLLFYSAHQEDKPHHAISITPQIQIVRTDEQKQRLESEFSSITSLVNMYIFMTYYLLEIPDRESIVAKIRELFKDDGSTEMAQRITGEAAEWMGKPFEDFPSDVVMGLKNKFAYARVRLDASDEQIKKDFEQWLAYERTRRNSPAPKKNFSETELNSWHESAVLPYLDLTFWAEEQKVKINQYVIAQAIFPDAYSMESDADPLGRLKTTKKKADFLMDYEVMKLLELQAAA